MGTHQNGYAARSVLSRYVAAPGTHRDDGCPARGIPVLRTGHHRWDFFSSLLTLLQCVGGVRTRVPTTEQVENKGPNGKPCGVFVFADPVWSAPGQQVARAHVDGHILMTRASAARRVSVRPMANDGESTGATRRHAMNATCLRPGCGETAVGRGLCARCYRIACALVREKRTTWARARADGPRARSEARGSCAAVPEGRHHRLAPRCARAGAGEVCGERRPSEWVACRGRHS